MHVDTIMESRDAIFLEWIVHENCT
jgi:hypothetical protein